MTSFIFTGSTTPKPAVEDGDFTVKSNDHICVRATLKATFTVKYASVRSGKVSLTLQYQSNPTPAKHALGYVSEEQFCVHYENTQFTITSMSFKRILACYMVRQTCHSDVWGTFT